MTRPVLPDFGPEGRGVRPLPPADHQAAMLAAVARAHVLQIEALAEAALAMKDADLAGVDLTFLARELVEMTHQAAVIEAAVRRMSARRG